MILLEGPVKAFIACLVFGVVLAGCGGEDEHGQALVGVTVIDGLGNPPVANQVVVIRDGCIAEVTPAEGWKSPRGVQAIRLPGRFVMPGLIDTRARLTTLPPAGGGEAAPRMERSDSEKVLRTLLGFGITTVRDLAPTADGGVALRQDTAAGEILGPRIVHAEDAPPYLPIARRDGGGSLRDRLTWLEQVDLDGPEIRKMIAALVERRTPFGPTLPALYAELCGDDPRHRENPELHLTPVTLRDAWAKSALADERAPEDFARACQAWPRMLELTRRLHAGGVTLTAGSDLPSPWVIPGVSLHQELRLLHDAGIPPLEVLRIATHNGAVALGLGDETGSVAPGKVADLIVLAADPTALVSNTRAISHVFLGGRFLDPAALLAGDPP